MPAGRGVTGVNLPDRVKSLEWRARKAERIAGVPEETILEVLDRIRILLPGIAR